ncbi:MAG: hypothetical protein QM803_18165 [Rhodocyclaceae bacterium]
MSLTVMKAPSRLGKGYFMLESGGSGPQWLGQGVHSRSKPTQLSLLTIASASVLYPKKAFFGALSAVALHPMFQPLELGQSERMPVEVLVFKFEL